MLDSGRTIRDVGRELGVNHETLCNWVDRMRQERDGGRPGDLAADERAELVRLRWQVAQAPWLPMSVRPGRLNSVRYAASAVFAELVASD